MVIIIGVMGGISRGGVCCFGLFLGQVGLVGDVGLFGRVDSRLRGNDKGVEMGWAEND